MTDTEIAVVCKALSDENRVRIIRMLTAGERCACELLDTLAISQPTLSHHMKILAESGLVSVRKDGRWAHYTVNCARFAEFREVMGGICCAGGKQSASCNCG